MTLVAGVATHFHKALRGLSSAPVSINIETAFDSQIEVFNSRCDKITDAMWRHSLIKDDLDQNRGENPNFERVSNDLANNHLQSL